MFSATLLEHMFPMPHKYCYIYYN